jgi:trehalose 6-phosphate synthase/phosphatase
LPTQSEFSSVFWNSYIEVNNSFSNACLETLKANSAKNGKTDQNNLVWIHDYHLMLMPMMLKNKIEEVNISCRIAFFLHIPFPSWDMFR